MFLTRLIYPIIGSIVFYAMLVFIALMLLRLIFNYSDPNPFGRIGRFSYQLKKRTDRFVYPAARLLANFRIDPRYAPLVTILVSAILAYFALQIVGNVFFIIDVLTEGIRTGNVKWIIGILLYALLSAYVLLIFIRFISSWFVFTRNTFFGFVRKLTDPVLLPLQRLIPPVGMFDISAMILLIFIQLLQMMVLRVFEIS
ncbi:MAG TPA: YggT family protein [Pyrinomonadaceae bacterium]|nr:YggT family protein [Pyrinomonadaceae bacterium]